MYRLLYIDLIILLIMAYYTRFIFKGILYQTRQKEPDLTRLIKLFFCQALTYCFLCCIIIMEREKETLKMNKTIKTFKVITEYREGASLVRCLNCNRNLIRPRTKAWEDFNCIYCGKVHKA